MKRLLVSILTAVLLAGTGCASMSGIVHDPVNGPTVQAAAKIALTYGVIKFIDEDPVRQTAVLTFVDAASAVVSEDEASSIDDLGLKLNALIPFDKLNPAERALVASLIELSLGEVKRRVTLPESVPLADVREVLSWVKQAAELSLPL